MVHTLQACNCSCALCAAIRTAHQLIVFSSSVVHQSATSFVVQLCTNLDTLGDPNVGSAAIEPRGQDGHVSRMKKGLESTLKCEEPCTYCSAAGMRGDEAGAPRH